MDGDEAKLAEYSSALAAQLRADLPGWVERGVSSRTDIDLSEPARRAGAAAAAEVGDQIGALLDTDIDQQRSTPLALLRGAVKYPTAVLSGAGVPETVRDDFSRSRFPDDVYDLCPTSFADLSEAAAEAGICWGAAKAHVHLSRRRAASGR